MQYKSALQGKKHTSLPELNLQLSGQLFEPGYISFFFSRLRLTYFLYICIYMYIYVFWKKNMEACSFAKQAKRNPKLERPICKRGYILCPIFFSIYYYYYFSLPFSTTAVGFFSPQFEIFFFSQSPCLIHVIFFSHCFN